MSGTRQRYVVGAADELKPGSITIVPVGRHGVGVFNVDGTYHALTNYCPHRGAPLCLGEVDGTVRAGDEPYNLVWERDGEFLRCPWHGWEFDIASGRARAMPEYRVKRWTVLVEDGNVVLEGA